MAHVFGFWLNLISQGDQIIMWLCALSSSSFWWGNIRSWLHVSERFWPVRVSVWMKPEKKCGTQLGFSKNLDEKAPKTESHSVRLSLSGCQAEKHQPLNFYGGGRHTVNILNVRHGHPWTKGAQEWSVRDSTVKAERKLLSQYGSNYTWEWRISASVWSQ